jgi:hypothetical protein
MPKQARLNRFYSNYVVFDKFIFYQGRWYHINQFVAWEQGKFYMPKQARLNRFYSNYVVFDKFITTKSNTPSAVSQNTHFTV